jgi:hypothetical protein
MLVALAGQANLALPFGELNQLLLQSLGHRPRKRMRSNQGLLRLNLPWLQPLLPALGALALLGKLAAVAALKARL